MSILKAMYAGASGLGAHAEAISVVSDNISNMNTVGFKASRARFEDILGSTVAGAVDNQAVGQGVRMAGAHASFVQGSLIGTRQSTDMAIQGEGFFILRGAADGLQDGSFYTRDGQFHISAEGKLVNNKGLVVQGYAADESQNLSTTLEDLEIPLTAVVPPKFTSTVDIKANLSPNDASHFMSGFDVNDPQATSHFSTSVTVYDTLGVSHNLNIFFTQTSTGNWQWRATANGEEMTDPANPGQALTGLQVVAGGTLSFDTSGSLDTDVQDPGIDKFDFFNAGTQSIAFDFGSSITTDGGDGLNGTSQFDSPSTISSMEQDGYGSGALAGMRVDQDGSIIGTFTNGERRLLASVGLARFVNNDGLVRRDAGNWAETPQSGQALVGSAGSGGRGGIIGNSVEQSTVELAHEFVNIISYQRGFQANSRSIRTADELLTEAVNLKR